MGEILSTIPSMTADLLQEIDSFLGLTGMSETAFGKGAVNDGKFVPNVRKGRRVWPETADRVRTFMRDYASRRSEMSPVPQARAS